MTLLLMAAGRGSRYGSLKQFDALGPNGEFLMEYSIYDAIRYDFDHIVAVTQKSNVKFLKEYLGERIPDTVKLDIVAQSLSDLPTGTHLDTSLREKPLGTAHAVWSARRVVDDSFVVINADDFYGASGFEQAADFIKRSKGENYALIGYSLSDTLSTHGTVSRGVCQTSEGVLVNVEEYTELQSNGNVIRDLATGKKFHGEEYVSMNFWVCRANLFDHISVALQAFLKSGPGPKSEIYLPFVIQEILTNKKISVNMIASNGTWFGVTYKSDKKTAECKLREMTEKGQYPSPLWN